MPSACPPVAPTIPDLTAPTTQDMCIANPRLAGQRVFCTHTPPPSAMIDTTYPNCSSRLLSDHTRNHMQPSNYMSRRIAIILTRTPTGITLTPNYRASSTQPTGTPCQPTEQTSYLRQVLFTHYQLNFIRYSQVPSTPHHYDLLCMTVAGISSIPVFFHNTTKTFFFLL